MIETIGKKLCQARLAKGLSIEEAAHLTRVRPDKLIALENDDYSRFGSNAYAKGFLQIYGRFLSVDVSDQAQALETPRYVTISDYQYLNNAPEPEPNRIQLNNGYQRPSIVPLVLVVGMMLIGAAVVLGYWINVNMQRLEPKTASQQAPASQGTAPNPSTPATAVMASPSAISNPATAPGAAPQPVVNSQNQQSGDAAALLEPIGEAATPAQAGPAVTNEIVVEPLKKTWVKIRKDTPTSAPVFEDYLYPGARPLKLRGGRFYVEVRDHDAVQIRKNGSPIAYQAPGISIQ